MNMFEDLAVALDDEGIEYRVSEDRIMVPIGSGVEVQIVAFDPDVDAANVYISAADDIDGSLVAAVFSVKQAVDTLLRYINTDAVISLMKMLTSSDDERIAGVEFLQGELDPMCLFAEVGETSFLLMNLNEDQATAHMYFVRAADPEIAPELLLEQLDAEVMDLGSFDDFERLLDVIAICIDQAPTWERELAIAD